MVMSYESEVLFPQLEALLLPSGTRVVLGWLLG
jgi:hypothetical protein